ncbi:hypothetical protein WUBG_02088, partial [Wuchereria bancrofti]
IDSQSPAAQRLMSDGRNSELQLSVNNDETNPVRSARIIEIARIMLQIGLMTAVPLNLVCQLEFIFVKLKPKNNGRKRSVERNTEDAETAPTQPKRCSFAETKPASPASVEMEQTSRSLLDSGFNGAGAL